MTINPHNKLLNELLNDFGCSNQNDKPLDLLSKLVEISQIKQNVVYSDTLSLREKTCLLMAANGMTTVQTANLMNIGVSTVATHRASILRKLNAKNITHAVYVSVQYGLFSMPHTAFNLE